MPLPPAEVHNFLFDELAERIAKGPILSAFWFSWRTMEIPWTTPPSTGRRNGPVLDLGAVALTEPVPDNAHEQKHIIFDPIPRVEGIDPSEDPLLELRAADLLDEWTPAASRA